MKFKSSPINVLRIVNKLVLLSVVFAMLIATANVYGQIRRVGRISSSTTTSSADLVSAAAADLDQCANGSFAAHVSCTGANWVNGDVNAQKAHWAETESLVYRLKMNGLTIGPSHTLILGYDILKNGKHAIDYLTSFDRTETQGAPDTQHNNGNDPCNGLPAPGCTTAAPTSTFAIPEDTVTVTSQTNPNTGIPVPQVPGVFTMWNGTITDVHYVTYAGGEERQISITFTAASDRVLLAWGGHVAWQGEWGFGTSAGGINGSPYHMRIIDLDGSGGNTDRALAATAVAIPAKVTLVKDIPGITGAATLPFRFQVTNLGNFTTNCPLNIFPDAIDNRDVCLVDAGNLSFAGISSQFAFPAITTTFAQTGVATATEPQGFGPTTGKQAQGGFRLTGLGCAEANVGGAALNLNASTSSLDVQSGTNLASIRPDLGDSIVCTFTNQSVTAADASVSGRVLSSTGLAVARALVTVLDPLTQTTKTAYTNISGVFTISGLEVGKLYSVSVTHPNFTFTNSAQSFVLNDNLSGLVFVADAPPARRPAN